MRPFGVEPDEILGQFVVEGNGILEQMSIMVDELLLNGPAEPFAVHIIVYPVQSVKNHYAKALEEYVVFYNLKRLHLGINLKTPYQVVLSS
ncbi:MAG: hypothetical protein ABIB04_04000 [Patescibacteria group bacterium]